jgi:hypothetical protein
MVSKGTFECLSLKHANDNYFLRPDFILGVFQVDHSIKFKLNPKVLTQLETERKLDLESVTMLEDCNSRIKHNINKINEAVQSCRKGAPSELPMLQQAKSVKDDDKSSTGGGGGQSMDSISIVTDNGLGVVKQQQHQKEQQLEGGVVNVNNRVNHDLKVVSRLPISRQGSKLSDQKSDRIGTSLDQLDASGITVSASAEGEAVPN